jgi:hypothetical protein
MKIRTAVLTGVTGLMLNMGLGTAVFAQPVYRYRSAWQGRQGGGYWQAQQMVRQAYRDILGRDPDPSGMQEYTDAIVNRGWSIGEVRHSLVTSPEYAQRFGYGPRGGFHSGWRYR